MERNNEINQLSRRPWLGVDSLKIEIRLNHIYWDINFTNSGRVPALVTLSVVVIAVPGLDELDVAFQANPAPDANIAKTLVLPERKIFTEGRTTAGQIPIKEIKSGSWRFWLQAVAIYTDTETGIEHRTRICYTYDAILGQFKAIGLYNDAD